jgi:thiol-disulfide isomerase/thioredoxin
MILRIITFLTGLAIFSCSGKEMKSIDLPGEWRGELELKPGLFLPFIFHFDSLDGKLKFIVHNAEERLVFEDLELNKDSLHIDMLHFNSRIDAVFRDGEIRGLFIKYYKEDYKIPFFAKKGSFSRFMEEGENPAPLAGKWEVHFASDKELMVPSIAEFFQDGDHLKGTFLTITGDYRYLEGSVQGNALKLSTFDGEHAFLFTADLHQDTLRGVFYSGNHWEESWYAFRNPGIELASPLALNFATTPDSTISFSFPNELGEFISLDDPRYIGKPVIIQILGTWCPNCMDETLFLVDWYRKREKTGPEILGLAFERKRDFSYGSTRITKMKEKLEVEYEVLFSGYYDKDSASRVLSFIDRVISYPTLIFLDQDHRIKHFHTGFTGPGTGVHYEKFKKDFSEMVDGIMGEYEEEI